MVERWEHGTAVRCTPLPDFYVYNAVRVEGAVPGLGVDTIVHAADVLLGDLGHRQVEVEDEVAGARLRPGFEALGWTTERLVWLSSTGSVPSSPELEEVAFADTRGLRLEWSLTFPWIGGEEAAVRFALAEERAAEVRGSRALMTRDEAGAGIAFAVFDSDGGTAEIDQVYVTPARRGRGLGGGLVEAAVRAGGAAETFIVADDEGEPKRLYRRLGFEPVWRQHTFTRRPG